MFYFDIRIQVDALKLKLLYIKLYLTNVLKGNQGKIKMYCINYLLTANPLTFNKYCVCYLLYMIITNHQNKTLYNKILSVEN